MSHSSQNLRPLAVVAPSNWYLRTEGFLGIEGALWSYGVRRKPDLTILIPDVESGLRQSFEALLGMAMRTLGRDVAIYAMHSGVGPVLDPRHVPRDLSLVELQVPSHMAPYRPRQTVLVDSQDLFLMKRAEVKGMFDVDKLNVITMPNVLASVASEMMVEQILDSHLAGWTNGLIIPIVIQNSDLQGIVEKVEKIKSMIEVSFRGGFPVQLYGIMDDGEKLLVERI